MIALRIEYLTGRCVATEYNDRSRCEWPPHPLRVFAALVDTWASADPRLEPERAVLERLATAPPPGVIASTASARSVKTHYVPVNDVSIIADAQLDRRRRAMEDAANALSTLSAPSSDSPVTAKKAAAARKKLDKARKAYEEYVASRVAAPSQTAFIKSDLDKADKLLPAHRGRQARHFPSVTPHEPVVHLVWQDLNLDDSSRAYLDALCRRVVRIGHSSSLVYCRLVKDTPSPEVLARTSDAGEGPEAEHPSRRIAWVCDDAGEVTLRVPMEGVVDAMVSAYASHNAVEPRVMPCRFQRYREAAPAHPRPARSDFDPQWIVYRRTGGPVYDSTRCVDIATAIRNALLDHATDPVPALISGHEPNGDPARSAHLAIVPLPFVGHAHADGRIMGVALVLPRQVDPNDRQALVDAVARWEATTGKSTLEPTPVPVLMGKNGVLEIERHEWGVPHQQTLRSRTWCRSSRIWGSVTPIALDENPGDLFSKNAEKQSAAYHKAEKVVRASCARIGLPAPATVAIAPSVTLPGTRKARHFPSYPPKPGAIRRVKVHAYLEFPERVAGPLLLGAGRYRGLGLMRPLPDGGIQS